MTAKQNAPNIVFIFADDLGYGDLACYGAAKVKTPNIDKIAAQGRIFTDAHSASAVCTPSRYALLTGEYPSRKGDLWGPVMLKEPLVVDTDRLTLGQLMKDAGYATACIGKWHLGFGNTKPTNWNAPLKPGPLELGFDYFFGIPVVSSHPPFVYVENHEVVGYDPDDPFVYGETAETQTFEEKMGLDWIGGARKAHEIYDDRKIGTTIARKAVEWLREQHDNPFFLYLPTPHIHHPFTPAERFVGTSECGRYGDAIHELDWMVGEVMNTLEEMGVADNTLLVLTSDNGGMLNQGGQDAWKAGHHMNGSLFGFKFDVWEGGHRIRFIARWPGKITSGTQSDQLICIVDMLATFASLLGQDLPENAGRDSINVLETLLDDPEKPVREDLVLAPVHRTHLGIRSGDWMYIPAQGGGGFSAENLGDHAFGGPAATAFTGRVNSDIEDGKLRDDAPPAQLYNLKDDPQQTTNLYGQLPAKVLELQTLLEQKIASMQTTIVP